MPSVHEILRWANRSDVAREITRRGYRVSGETLNRWYRNRAEVPAVVEHIVFDLFGVEAQRNSPPAWAEGLADETAKKVIERLLGLSPEVVGAAFSMIAEREGELPPSADSAHDSTEESGRGGAAPPLRGLG